MPLLSIAIRKISVARESDLGNRGYKGPTSESARLWATAIADTRREGWTLTLTEVYDMLSTPSDEFFEALF